MARKRGRPRKLSDEIKVEILEALKDGMSRNDAAALCRISTTTIKNEADRDEEFAADLRQAEAEGKLYHLKRVRAGKQNWQSSAWFLERKYPRQFARRDGSSSKAKDSDLLEANEAMEAAETPPGAIPPLVQPVAVQDDSGGPAIGQDGAGETQVGVEPVGCVRQTPPVG